MLKCYLWVTYGSFERGRIYLTLDFLSGAEGDRTPDLMTASHALSHLSYSPKPLVRGHQEYKSHRRLSRAAQAALLMHPPT